MSKDKNKDDKGPKEGEEGYEPPKKAGFLDQWLNQGRVANPDRLSPYTIRSDKYDREDFEKLLQEIREFDIHRDKLCDAVDTGNGMWADTYFAFSKVDPKMVDPGEIRPKYLINQIVMQEAQELKEFEELRAYTPGDEVASAMACVTVEPDLENLYDKLRKEQELADQLEEQQKQLAGAQEEQRDLDEMIKEWSEQNDPNDPKNQKQAQNFQDQQARINQQIQQMIDDMNAKVDQLGDSLGEKQGQIRTAMKQALGKARDEAEALAQGGQMWGLEPGELQRMPAQQRMELAKRLNNPKFKKMTDLFGPMQRLMWTEQRRKVYHANDEVYDLSQGDDLSRTLPVEFLALDDPTLELDFYRRLSEQELLQFELRGEERVAKGGIITCIDNSGSMMGDNELWAKAVGLCMLHLARQQKRSYRGIHFGSSREIKVFDFIKPEDFSPQKIIDFAEFFFGGGTDFVSPLSLALDYLQKEHDETGSVKGDIVFITDGICGVPQEWLDNFVKERDRLQFTCWGILIGGMTRETEPLRTICNGRIATIGDILSGQEAKDLFGGV